MMVNLRDAILISTSNLNFRQMIATYIRGTPKDIS